MNMRLVILATVFLCVAGACFGGAFANAGNSTTWRRFITGGIFAFMLMVWTFFCVLT